MEPMIEIDKITNADDITLVSTSMQICNMMNVAADDYFTFQV